MQSKALLGLCKVIEQVVLLPSVPAWTWTLQKAVGDVARDLDGCRSCRLLHALVGIAGLSFFTIVVC